MVKRSRPYIENIIGKAITRDFNILYKVWTKMYGFEKNKKFDKELKQLWMYLGKGTTHHTVFSKALNALEDSDNAVLNQLDYQKDCLPIMGKKVIELKTLTVRDRTKEDYFTHYLPVSFLSGGDYPNAVRFMRSIMCIDDELQRMIFPRRSACR